MIRVSILCILSVASLMATTPAKSAPAGSTRKPPVAQSADFKKISADATKAKDDNRVDDAIALYRQALKLNSGWAEGWWWLGTLFYDTDRYTEGRDAFRRFASIETKQGPGFAMLGLCEFQTGEYDRALAHLEHARQLGFPEAGQLYNVAMYHNALLLSKFEQFESAGGILMYLARSMQCSPSIAEALGITALRKPVLPADLSADDKPEILKIGRALCLAADRKAAEVSKAFQEIVKEYPNDPNVHYTYASLLSGTDPDTAIAEYDKTLQLNPKHLPALVSVCFEYLKRGEPEKALPYAKKRWSTGRSRSLRTHRSEGHWWSPAI